MIEDIVNQTVTTAEDAARLTAASAARFAVTIRGVPAQVTHVLKLADQLDARQRMFPAIGIMVASMTSLRHALDEVIAELERLTVVAS